MFCFCFFFSSFPFFFFFPSFCILCVSFICLFDFFCGLVTVLCLQRNEAPGVHIPRWYGPARHPEQPQLPLQHHQLRQSLLPHGLETVREEKPQNSCEPAPGIPGESLRGTLSQRRDPNAAPSLVPHPERSLGAPVPHSATPAHQAQCIKLSLERIPVSWQGQK